MKKNTLQRAREYEAEKGLEISREERPVFHLTPKVGWMNDPNGFCFYKGKYHMFFQYHPYSCFWGPMHWGHAVSEDLIHWDFLPAAIAPDSRNDKEGCFSGSAIETENGELALVYTGVRKDKKNKKKNNQIQCLAIGDGIDFNKFSTPILDSPQVPAGCSIEDFRDPKIIKNDDGEYIIYTVNRNKDGKGQVLAYRSNNLIDWDFCSCVLKNDFNLGAMWECPDLFNLNGTDVIMMSAQEVTQSEDFDSGNIGVCLLGNYDKTINKFIKTKAVQVDRGMDFYAQQTITSPDGRRIMIGWMQNWDICNYRTKNQKWYGQMSIPREIKIQNGILLQQPVKEIEKYRQNKQEIKDLKVENEKIQIPQIKGRSLDVTISLKKYDIGLSYFTVNLFEGNGHCARVYYDFKRKIAGVDRSRTGVRNALLHERSCNYKFEENTGLKLRIIADRNSVEAFWGDGELAMSMSIYQEEPERGFSLEVSGSAELDIVSYEIKDKGNE